MCPFIDTLFLNILVVNKRGEGVFYLLMSEKLFYISSAEDTPFSFNFFVLKVLITQRQRNLKESDLYMITALHSEGILQFTCESQ